MMRTTPAIMSSRAFDQFFESFFTQPDQWVKNSTEGYPLTDIWREDDDTQVIQMALAGFARDNLSVETDKNRITISSSKSDDEDVKSSRRIARRSFTKTFVDHQNQLDMSKADAEFKDGLLTVRIPSIIKSKKTTIKIK
jgi:molecular chaperone IbpA